MGNLKVKDLFNHLQTYKDAVIYSEIKLLIN